LPWKELELREWAALKAVLKSEYFSKKRCGKKRKAEGEAEKEKRNRR